MDKIIQLLINLNVPKIQARLIDHLSDFKSHISKDMEHDLWIRQSEASVALSATRGIGKFVSVVTERSENKGRPIKVYQMSKEQYKKYLLFIVGRWEKDIAKSNRNVDELKEFAEKL